MKHDKKTQRALHKASANGNREEEDDDIVRNMTNLILHKQDQQPWEQNLLDLDTANSTNVMRPSTISKRQPFGTNKNADFSSLNLHLNPMVESFLSFNLNNTTTANLTNAANMSIENVYDQTLFAMNEGDNFYNNDQNPMMEPSSDN